MISESRRASSAAPNRVCTSPSGRMIAIAGCVATSKRLNTSAFSSLICGNDNEYRSTNSANSSSDPLQATPTNSAWPAHFCAASSTEGASRLQVLHHGAQNHSSTGRPASVVSSMSPPPRSGAVNCSAAGTATSAAPSEVASTAAAGDDAAGVAVDDAAGSDAGAASGVLAPPQATNSRPAKPRGTRRRITRPERSGRDAIGGAGAPGFANVSQRPSCRQPLA